MMKDQHIPYQTTIDQFLDEGITCPYCDQPKKFLVSIQFSDGQDFICEECRKYETLSDWFQPPTKTEFMKRIKRIRGYNDETRKKRR